jgi:hypothetical protein
MQMQMQMSDAAVALVIVVDDYDYVSWLYSAGRYVEVPFKEAKVQCSMGNGAGAFGGHFNLHLQQCTHTNATHLVFLASCIMAVQAALGVGAASSHQSRGLFHTARCGCGT